MHGVKTSPVNLDRVKMQCAMVLMFLRSFSLLGCLYVLFASVHVLCIIVLFFLDVCLLACFWRVLVAWLRWNVYQVHGITYTPSIYILFLIFLHVRFVCYLPVSSLHNGSSWPKGNCGSTSGRHRFTRRSITAFWPSLHRQRHRETTPPGRYSG